MRTRIAALVMAALLALYLVFTINYSTVLIGSGVPVAQTMGWALLVLPLIGIWGLAAELLFIFRADRLVSTLEDEDALPARIHSLLPSGRPDPAVADSAFEVYRAEAEVEPTSWRAWLRLGLAYDACGDRRRARWATRQAIRFSRVDKKKTA